MAMSLGEKAHYEIRRMIVRLDLPPGAIVREDELQAALGIGRTPIREALQRLAREQFVTVIPRRGMLVASLEVADLPVLYETRAMLEPYAARLACARGSTKHWTAIAATIERSHRKGVSDAELLDIDRACHETFWDAAGNRLLTDTLDVLYAQCDRLWHLYLSDVADMAHAVEEHAAILDALRDRDGDRAAALVEAHVRAFDAQIRDAVARHLATPARSAAS
jgi:DNA-binding GntR family transcriptional regulator